MGSGSDRIMTTFFLRKQKMPWQISSFIVHYVSSDYARMDFYFNVLDRGLS
jgi:hypothetical protein